MDVVYTVRDTLEVTSSSKDIETKARTAAEKAIEFINPQSSQKRRLPSQTGKKKKAKMSPPTTDNEGVQEISDHEEEEDEEENNNERVETPERQSETETEEDIFAPKKNITNSVPIKTIYQSQKDTEQLGMINEDSD